MHAGLRGEGGARARICNPTMSDEIFAVMSAFPEDWPAPRQHKVNWSPLARFRQQESRIIMSLPHRARIREALVAVVRGSHRASSRLNANSGRAAAVVDSMLAPHEIKS